MPKKMYTEQKNAEIYEPLSVIVSKSGSDNELNDRNETTPFLTINAAIKYVTSFNLRYYGATITVLEGTYTEDVLVPSYVSNVTPGITIIGGEDTIINGNIINISEYSKISNFSITANKVSSPVIYNLNGILDIDNINITKNIQSNVIECMDGKITLSNITCNGNASSYLCADKGKIVINGDCSFTGSVTNGCVSAINNGVIDVMFLDSRYPIMSGSVIGRRFFASSGGVINVKDNSESFFPGTTNGVLESGGIYTSINNDNGGGGEPGGEDVTNKSIVFTGNVLGTVTLSSNQNTANLTSSIEVVNIEKDCTITEDYNGKLLNVTKQCTITLPIINKPGYNLYIRNSHSEKITITSSGCTINSSSSPISLSSNEVLFLVLNGTNYLTLDTSAKAQ